MTTIAKQIDKWESAWEAYVIAAEAKDEAKQNTSRISMSGYKRGYDGCCIRLRKAVENLRKIDAEFCDRLGIE